jgi:hypothetical protein
VDFKISLSTVNKSIRQKNKQKTKDTDDVNNTVKKLVRAWLKW